MKNLSTCDGQLHFVVDSDLEEYRVTSIFEKEPETIEWINRFNCHDGAVFLDIGANIGIYSLYAGWKHSRLEVLSFEPVANNYVALLRNAGANPRANVKPFHIALAKKLGLTRLFLNDLRSGNSGAQVDAAINDRGEAFEALKIESVLCMSVDHLITEYGLPCPNYVKIDVDGHEPDILEGMIATLKKPALKSLLVEFNNQEQLEYWTERLAALGLQTDHSLDDLPQHSRHRRQKKGAAAMNCIFSRVESSPKDSLGKPTGKLK